MTLKRVLGATDAGWLVAGNMIGAGIFITPGLVAGHLPGLVWPLVAWGVGGVLALSGAAVYAELGARLPKAGGDYQYLASAFGPLPGFLMGWAALALTFSGAAAVMSIVSVQNLAAVWPALAGAPAGVRAVLPPLLVVLLTLANVAGARVAGRTTAWLTAVPLTGLLVMFGYGIASRSTALAWPETLGESGAFALETWGAALIPVFFTYSGWNAAAYVAGEIKDPGRNLARGLLVGTAFVTLLYVVINCVVLVVVPAGELAGSTTGGSQAARRLLGAPAEAALSLMIAVAVLGSANVTLMAGARIYYAMALDDLIPRVVARTNAAGVPSVAVWASGLWTALLSTTGMIERLVNWATLAILVLSSLAAASLFVYRKRDAAHHTFRCPGYPLTPVLYVGASLAVAVASAVHDWKQSLYGVLIVAAGVPLYLIQRAVSGRSNRSGLRARDRRNR